MEAIFMNTENSKTNEPHRFSLKLTDKLNLKDPNKNLALSNPINLKFQLQREMMNLICLMIHILFQAFKIILSTLMLNLPNLSSIQIYTNKIKKRIFLKIKTSCKLELLSPQTMKLLGSIK